MSMEQLDPEIFICPSIQVSVPPSFLQKTRGFHAEVYTGGFVLSKTRNRLGREKTLFFQQGNILQSKYVDS